MHDDTRRQCLRCVTLPLQSVKIYPWHFQTQCRICISPPTLLVAMSSINDFRESMNSMNSDSNTINRMHLFCKGHVREGWGGVLWWQRSCKLMIERTICNTFLLEGRYFSKQKIHATEFAWFGSILALSTVVFKASTFTAGT